MSLTVHQLLSDAKRLTSRLRDDDAAADGIISSAQEVLKEVEAMKQYQEDIDNLNTIAHNRPRAQLVLGIQQENRHIRQLQHENKELRAALEEHQNALELIMSKYRQHIACLVHSTKVDKNVVNQEKARLLQERADKICEMASVMHKSIQLDEENQAKEQEAMSRLVTENRGLREMLEISYRNGSYADPLVGPRLVSTSCQTEEVSTASVPASHAPSSSQWECASGGGSNGSSASNPKSTSSPSRHLENTMNGAPDEATVSGGVRPLSSASEESEETSSISEDDEITFNTIKRQTVKKLLLPATDDDRLGCDEEQRAVSENKKVEETINSSSSSDQCSRVNGDTQAADKCNEDNNNGLHDNNEESTTTLCAAATTADKKTRSKISPTKVVRNKVLGKMTTTSDKKKPNVVES